MPLIRTKKRIFTAGTKNSSTQPAAIPADRNRPSVNITPAKRNGSDAASIHNKPSRSTPDGIDCHRYI
jgi:hypothetical protein